MIRSTRTQYKLRQVAWITLAWTLVSILDSIFIYLLYQNKEFVTLNDNYSFITNLIIHVIAAIVASSITGAILIFYLRSAFKTYRYGLTSFIHSIIILILIILLTSLSTLVYSSVAAGNSLFSGEVLSGFFDRITTLSFLRLVILWYIIINLTLIGLNVNDKYGPGVLLEFLMGKYHHPREEQRIFMFLDMNSSTRIAEEIGHVKFYNLLNDVYRHVTDPILSTSGEIYQYVGDEVVVSWKLKNGLKNYNCINCYFRVKEALTSQASFYQNKYGLVPEFKAGYHIGEVTVGEVGVVKKDIVFTGDVLNTAARIRTKCTEVGTNLLISEQLFFALKLPPHQFQSKKMGSILFKGKQTKTTVYTLELGIHH